MNKWIVLILFLFSVFIAGFVIAPTYDPTALHRLFDDTDPCVAGDLDGQETYDLVDFVDGTFIGKVAPTTIVVKEYYEVTGELNPDTTGKYVYDGEFGGYPSYKKVADGWYIYAFYIAGEWYWTINNEKTLTPVPPLWGKTGHPMEGEYTPSNTTGIATVSSCGVGTNTNWDAAYDHISNDGTDHSFIDQDLQVAASPTFAGLTIDGTSTFNDDVTLASGKDIDYANIIYLAVGFRHHDDADTYFTFEPDCFYFTAGGLEFLRIKEQILALPDELVVNEQGVNIDLRVESQTNANCLFVDASTSRVGINVVAPTVALDVAGDGAFSGALDVEGNIDPTSYETTRGGFKDEDDLASDSAVAVASQQSVKAYVDNQIAAIDFAKIKTGTYVGNAEDDHDIDIGVDLASKSNVWVVIKSESNSSACHRIEYGQGNLTMGFTAIADFADGIKSFTSTGFRLGVAGNSNGFDITYRYIATWQE